MGNLASIIFKRASRPVKEFNLESRLEKVITSEKPKPAPRHDGTAISKMKNEELNKNLFESDDKLLKRLEQVFVTSTDEKEYDKGIGSSRPLPSSREYVDEGLYGYQEPKFVPYGKTTLKQALEFISYHNQTPEEWSAQRIAEEYKLDVSRTEKLLKYFNTYTVIVPPAKSKKTKTFSMEHIRSLGARNIVELPPPPDTGTDTDGAKSTS